MTRNTNSFASILSIKLTCRNWETSFISIFNHGEVAFKERGVGNIFANTISWENKTQSRKQQSFGICQSLYNFQTKPSWSKSFLPQFPYQSCTKLWNMFSADSEMDGLSKIKLNVHLRMIVGNCNLLQSLKPMFLFSNSSYFKGWEVVHLFMKDRTKAYFLVFRQYFWWLFNHELAQLSIITLQLSWIL